MTGTLLDVAPPLDPASPLDAGPLLDVAPSPDSAPPFDPVTAPPLDSLNPTSPPPLHSPISQNHSSESPISPSKGQSVLPSSIFPKSYDSQLKPPLLPLPLTPTITHSQIAQIESQKPKFKSGLCRDLIQTYGSVQNLNLTSDISSHIEISGDSLQISIPGDICTNIAEKWEHSLIVNIPNIDLHTATLQNRLFKLWNLLKSTSFSLLGHNFYLLSKVDLSDRLRILTTGPWLLGNQVVLVRSWIQNFSPSSFSIVTSIWISLLLLLVEFLCPDILNLIGNAFGKFLAIDSRNLSNNLLSVTGFCVEIDLKRKLPNAICINGLSIKVIYENLSLIVNSLSVKSHELLVPLPNRPSSQSLNSNPANKKKPQH